MGARSPPAPEPIRQMRTLMANVRIIDLKFSGEIIYQDDLKHTWRSDNKRPWGTYAKEEQFTYSWDFRPVEHRHT